MRPLVNLVRHHPDPAEREAEDRDGASPGSLERNREEAEENRNRKKGDVTVSLDKTAHGEIVSSPCAGAPVNEPGSEIGRRHSADKRHRNRPLPQIKPRRDAKPERSERQKSRRNRDAREEKLRARQLIVGRQALIRRAAPRTTEATQRATSRS